MYIIELWLELYHNYDRLEFNLNGNVSGPMITGIFQLSDSKLTIFSVTHASSCGIQNFYL